MNLSSITVDYDACAEPGVDLIMPYEEKIVKDNLKIPLNKFLYFCCN